MISRSSRTRSFWDRFWAKVDPASMADLFACWIWIGATVWSRGKLAKYGKIWRDRRHVLAHRAVCELYHGPPPTADHEAGHICPAGENSLCVNPAHVEWQSPEENYQRQKENRKRIETSRR